MNTVHLRFLALLSAVLIFVITFHCAVATGFSSNIAQVSLKMDSDLDQWQLIPPRNWDTLGPFPIHAREQHIISPGFPLSCEDHTRATIPIEVNTDETSVSAPYSRDLEETWPSSLSESGEVSWKAAFLNPRGELAVSFPDVRWEKIRATEGWAGLQFHSVLRAPLTFLPPRTKNPRPLQPKLRVELTQGSFFTILPREATGVHPEWHPGNIYGMAHAAPNTVELPGVLNPDKPTTFDFYISGDYEIRLFGDPRSACQEVPTLKINLAVTLEENQQLIVRQATHDITCDFVDGFAFGDALGIGLRSIDGWWTVDDIKLPEQFPTGLSLSLLHKQVIAPSQTRVVPISIQQTEAYNAGLLSFDLVLKERHEDNGAAEPRTVSIPIRINLRHLKQWDTSNVQPIRATFFFAASHPTYILAKAPTSPNSDGHSSYLPLLALHGAGVDIISQPLWADALPRQEHSWIVMPVGRTEWGLDWHGPSASEAWATLSALGKILHSKTEWKSWAFLPDTRAVVIGHSNGGQGAWYLASRFPDRTHAVIPAAGYLSPAAYVPLTPSHGARFADPALRSILESSFMPDDNALFLGNLVDNVPVLAVHGGNDTNVPTWHSREYVSIMKSLGNASNVSFHVDGGQQHWYPGVFESDTVLSFLKKVLDPDNQNDKIVNDASYFTLTVADPVRSGSMHGCTIDELIIPGRLARLQVDTHSGNTHIRTTNVRKFSVDSGSLWCRSPVVVDGSHLSMAAQEKQKRTFTIAEDRSWRQESQDSSSSTPVPPGRLQNIFDTSGPITIVIPSDPHFYTRMLSAALRISHALDVYIKIDSEIITDTEALHRLNSNSEGNPRHMQYHFQGNIVILGGKENALSRKLLQVPQSERQTEFGISESGEWLFRNRVLPDADKDIGILFTHPNHLNPYGAAVILAGSSDDNSGGSEGLERVLRLLVPRTGIAAPDWIIVGKEADQLGIGGVLGAGYVRLLPTPPCRSPL
ncbi:uncharacterized protein FOMMEDRAFT_157287 [Fomitiporia mediterranea MF3/22]|uniref:uncharacterized protein n=1 Tax=Fomitiporia mediterranea (strain MF3/22) TaxID=694068 RepID=UPI0004407C52|nr:uncharacterized protein FOMMEDRAFT_157287 [Fomitiporia mediterranea MF3/22]EJD02092.1 hypothetical protein FOMMEDRAFT_157287 [Fomitiporia mediterranea MF3/22]